MKRGIKVWSESLPSDIELFLRSLSEDVFDLETGAFIRKENGTVLVQYLPTNRWPTRRDAFPYVAYVDLRTERPRIQFRVPILPLPFFIVFMGAIAWASFEDTVALIMLLMMTLLLFISHLYQRKRLMEFIRERMQAYSAC
jgi:hypothetical protein